MFAYVQNRYNPEPAMVLAPAKRREDQLVCDLEFTTRSVLSLPADLDGFRAMRSRKSWQTVRRKERRFEQAHGPLRYRSVTSKQELRDELPRVQELYATRWADEYTSLDWKSDAGFAPYAEAMIDLASTGEAELDVLDCESGLLAFQYGLVRDGTYHGYQHAAVRDPEYWKYSVGNLLNVKVLTDVVGRGTLHTFDFMLGESEYKSEWATAVEPVYLRIAEERTVAGRARFATRVAAAKVRAQAQFSGPTRTAGKKVMLGVQRLRQRGATGAPTG